MSRVLLLLGVLVVAVVAGFSWAFKHLPWWQSVVLVLAMLVVGKFLAGRLFVWALSIPFKWKGAVLRRATIQVHAVIPKDSINRSTKPPTDADDSDDGAASEDAARLPFELEVTVTPTQSPGKFTHWGPNDLSLVKPETKLRLHGREDEDDSCEVKRVEVEENGQFKETEGLSYAGPQRLKLLLAVQPGVTRLKFRYYFEEFGEVTLPPHPASAAGSVWDANKAA